MNRRVTYSWAREVLRGLGYSYVWVPSFETHHLLRFEARKLIDCKHWLYEIDWFWLCEILWRPNVYTLWNAGVPCAWNFVEQRAWEGSWLVVPWNSDLWNDRRNWSLQRRRPDDDLLENIKGQSEVSLRFRKVGQKFSKTFTSCRRDKALRLPQRGSFRHQNTPMV